MSKGLRDFQQLKDFLAKQKADPFAPSSRAPELKSYPGKSSTTATPRPVVETIRSEHFRRGGVAPVSPAVGRAPTKPPLSGPSPRSNGWSASTGAGRGAAKPIAPAAIVLGVDFGTRFTKVCYRFVGDERSSLVERKPGHTEGALWPSRLFVDAADASVHLQRPKDSEGRVFELPYLKMRLRDPKAAEFAAHPRIAGVLPEGSEHGLAAYYLADVIRRSRADVERREAGRLAGRARHWQVNLSVPAQYHDERAVDIFRDAGEVALTWSEQPQSPNPPTVKDLSRRFGNDRALAGANGNVKVFAEIVAALHHFVKRPDTPEGIHGFLDIGGGTLDSCVFRLFRDKEGPTVNLLAALVEPLGTVPIAKKALLGLYQDLNATIETQVVGDLGVDMKVELPLGVGEDCVRKFVGKLLASARDRSPARTLQQPDALDRSDPTRLRPQDRFTFHSSGGGASSLWYRRTVEGTHAAFKHAASGIMRYDVKPVEAPDEFGAHGEVPFARFVIAHGLSSPEEELDEVRYRLPSQLGAAFSPSERQVRAADYLSSKEQMT